MAASGLAVTALGDQSSPDLAGRAEFEDHRDLSKAELRELAGGLEARATDDLAQLEEAGDRASFLEAGGESLTLIPCLNEDPAWIGALEGYARA